jgi:CRP/FNR family transcriptional regulator, cyclic AMP receptor protein
MVELLQRIALFSSLRKRELEHIAGKLVEYRCPKDGLILMEADTGSSLFLLVKGRVKISRTSGSGGEVILAILKSGDVFGEISLLDGESRTANVTAIEDAEMLVLRREDFLAAVERYPKIAIGMLKELASRLRKSDSQIKSLSLLNAKGRVASTLLQLADPAEESGLAAVEIQEMPTQQDMANMAGTSRETISRVLRQMENTGYLERDHRYVLIRDKRKFTEKYL